MATYGRPPLAPAPAQAVFQIQGRWINLEPLHKDTSLYVLCRSFVHNDLHKRKLPERQHRLGSFSQEIDKFALLLTEHPPAVTSVPKLRGRTCRKREILNSARNMPAPQLLRSHLAYCRELKNGAKVKRKVLNQHAAARLEALRERFASYLKKRKALVLKSDDAMAMASPSGDVASLVSIAQTLAPELNSASTANLPPAKRSR